MCLQRPDKESVPSSADNRGSAEPTAFNGAHDAPPVTQKQSRFKYRINLQLTCVSDVALSFFIGLLHSLD